MEVLEYSAINFGADNAWLLQISLYFTTQIMHPIKYSTKTDDKLSSRLPTQCALRKRMVRRAFCLDIIRLGRII